MACLWSSHEGRLSAQVLNEYYATVTGKLVPGLPLAEARGDVARLLTWSPLPVDAALIDDALEIGEVLACRARPGRPLREPQSL